MGADMYFDFIDHARKNYRPMRKVVKEAADLIRTEKGEAIGLALAKLEEILRKTEFI